MTLSHRAPAVYVRLRVAFVSTGCHSKVGKLAIIHGGGGTRDQPYEVLG